MTTLVLFAFALTGLVNAQASEQSVATGSVDPTTGALARLPSQAAAPPPQAAASSGEVIGYTTDAVVDHILDLSIFISAVADLTAVGHSIVPIDALEPNALQGIDRLVVGLVRDGFSLDDAQVDVLEEYVLAGGKLLFVGENTSFFENNVAVGGRFGITYPPDITQAPGETAVFDIKPHPITNGPFGVVSLVSSPANGMFGFGSMLSAGPNGTSLLDFPDGSSAGVVIEPGALGSGSGVVFAVAEVNMWLQDYFVASNRALFRNAMAYTGLVEGLVTIGFDDEFGKPPPFGSGTPSSTEFLIDIEYLDQGVLFDSAGGGVVASAASNVASPPNLVTASGPGPVISYSDPATATFWEGDRPESWTWRRSTCGARSARRWRPTIFSGTCWIRTRATPSAQSVWKRRGPSTGWSFSRGPCRSTTSPSLVCRHWTPWRCRRPCLDRRASSTSSW